MTQTCPERLDEIFYQQTLLSQLQQQQIDNQAALIVAQAAEIVALQEKAAAQGAVDAGAQAIQQKQMDIQALQMQYDTVCGGGGGYAAAATEAPPASRPFREMAMEQIKARLSQTGKPSDHA